MLGGLQARPEKALEQRQRKPSHLKQRWITCFVPQTRSHSSCTIGAGWSWLSPVTTSNHYLFRKVSVACVRFSVASCIAPHCDGQAFRCATQLCAVVSVGLANPSLLDMEICWSRPAALCPDVIAIVLDLAIYPAVLLWDSTISPTITDRGRFFDKIWVLPMCSEDCGVPFSCIYPTSPSRKTDWGG